MAGPLPSHSVCRSHSIFTGAGPLTRLVAAVSAGHASVEKDFVTAASIPSSHVKASFLENLCAGGSPCPMPRRAALCRRHNRRPLGGTRR